MSGYVYIVTIDAYMPWNSDIPGLFGVQRTSVYTRILCPAFVQGFLFLKQESFFHHPEGKERM